MDSELNDIEDFEAEEIEISEAEAEAEAEAEVEVEVAQAVAPKPEVKRGRKPVTFAEVEAAFAEVKDQLGITAELCPVEGDAKKCCLISDGTTEVQTLANMKSGLAVAQLLAKHQTKLLSE